MQSLVFIFILALVVKSCVGDQMSTQTESIVELYKKINAKGSLAAGVSLNQQAQTKLRTVDTIRLEPLIIEHRQMSNNHFLLRLNVSLSKVRSNEEIKLIELRLKLAQSGIKPHRRTLILIVRQQTDKGMRKRRIRPLFISSEQSEYFSYDLTDYLSRNESHQDLIIRRQPRLMNHLRETSLIIYSRSPGIFLLPTPITKTKRSIRQQENGPCSKRDLFVDFNQLSFGAWVVEPKQFNAGACRGDCPNPLSRLFYPTNHAMLISLLHERGTAIQQPSCVPVRLRPLDLLYYDHRELVIKRHQGMQVEECGCR